MRYERKRGPRSIRSGDFPQSRGLRSNKIKPVFFDLLPGIRPDFPHSCSLKRGAQNYLVNIRNVAGFVGPYAFGYLHTSTGSFSYGLAGMAIAALIAGIVLLNIPSAASVEWRQKNDHTLAGAGQVLQNRHCTNYLRGSQQHNYSLSRTEVLLRSPRHKFLLTFRAAQVLCIAVLSFGVLSDTEMFSS